MDLGKVFLGLLLCGYCITVQGVSSIAYTGPTWYPMGSNATVTCVFKISEDDVRSVEVAWWKGSGASGLKIGVSHYNSADSFTYGGAPDNIVLSSERFNVGMADMIIKGISIADVSPYECEGDNTNQHVATRTSFPVNVYNDPTVTVEDIEIELDIRPQPEQQEAPTENTETEDSENEGEEQPTESENSVETTAAEDPQQQDASVTIVKCYVVNSYPMPSVIKFYGTSSTSAEQEWSIPSSDFEETAQTNADGTFNVSARLRIVPTADLDGVVIRCSAIITSQDREIFSMDQSSPIEVKHHPSEISVNILPSNTVDESTEVTVSCDSDGNPSPKKSLQLPDGATTDVTHGSHTFTADRDSSGPYRCVIEDQDGVVQFVDEAELTVNWMSIPVIEGPTVARKGDRISLTCSSNSNTDNISYQWTKNNEFVYNGNMLVLDAVTVDNAGTYTCEASGHRVLSTEYELQVEVGCVPVFQTPVVTDSMTVDDANHVRLTCVAEGNPECTMSLTPSYQGIEPEVSANKIELVVPAFERQMNAPKFVCTASNQISTNNVSILLDGVCCIEPISGGVSTGVVILIIIIVILVVIGIPLGCYLVKRRKASKGSMSTSKNEKTVDDVEADKLNTPTDENDA